MITFDRMKKRLGRVQGKDKKHFMTDFQKGQDFEMVATCMQHLEPLLEQELKALGAKQIRVLKRAVSFKGDHKLMYNANLWLRTALKVLVPIHSFRARKDEILYKEVKEFPWENYFSAEATFSIDAAVHSEHFSHSRFALLKVKDAIVDRFRENGGIRPNIDREDPDIKIHLHIRSDRVDLSLDSSGEPLFKRGYKQEQHKAPINESLAAAMVMLSGWKGDMLLLDPMCGSATIAIEAALITANIPPNLHRERFGFENWSSFDGGLLAEVLEEGRKSSKPPQVKIIVRDKDPRSLRAARVNINASKMKSYIEVQEGDFFKMSAPEENGFLIFNPPYGERLGEEEAMKAFYAEIGSRLKHEYSGWKASLISSDIEAMKSIGLKPDQKIPLMNGKLECQMRKYTMFAGKRADHKVKNGSVE